MPTKTEAKWAKVMALKKLPEPARELLEHLRLCLGGKLPDCPICRDTGQAKCETGVGWTACECQRQR